MQKVMVIGGSSQIGQEIYDNLVQNHYEVYKTTRNLGDCAEKIIYLDLLDVTKFQCIISFDVVILCAALTKIETCELNENLSEEINYLAQIQLVKYFKKQNPFVHIIFLSSNAVFNGKKPFYQTIDCPDPISIYGKHKRKTEIHLETIHHELTILRLTKVLNKNQGLFNSWVNALENQQLIYPFSNVYLAPVAINQVAEVVLNIIKTKSYGLYHLSGNRDISYYELALNIAKLKSLNDSLIKKNYLDRTKKINNYSSLANNNCECVYKDHDFSIDSVLSNIFGITTCVSKLFSI